MADLESPPIQARGEGMTYLTPPSMLLHMADACFNPEATSAARSQARRFLDALLGPASGAPAELARELMSLCAVGATHEREALTLAKRVLRDVSRDQYRASLAAARLRTPWDDPRAHLA